MAPTRVVSCLLQCFPLVETIWFVLTFAVAIGGVIFTECGWSEPVIDFTKATAADFFEVKFYNTTVYSSKSAEHVRQVYPIIRWASFIVCTVLGSLLGAAIGYLLYRMTTRKEPSTEFDASKHAKCIKTKRLVARFVFAIFSFALVATAFLWGNYLLGFIYGVGYGILAAALLYILAQLLVFKKKPLLIPLVLVIVLSVMAGYLMVRPTAFSPDLQYLIDIQASDRKVRRELTTVLASDPAFSDLSISTMQTKWVNVTIHGLLKDIATFHRLRGRIVSECPEVDQWSILDWDVQLREERQRISGRDPGLIEKDK